MPFEGDDRRIWRPELNGYDFVIIVWLPVQDLKEFCDWLKTVMQYPYVVIPCAEEMMREARTIGRTKTYYCTQRRVVVGCSKPQDAVLLKLTWVKR